MDVSVVSVNNGAATKSKSKREMCGSWIVT
jgi:hypothetical protein